MEFGFSPIQSEPRYDAMIAQCKLAEALGFHTLWTHEHHSQAMMYPDPLMALAVIAPHTERIRLGTNMLLLPEWHPLRVAEQGAMLDVLSSGRLSLGVAAGYAKDEFAAFGVSLRERGTRMEEGLSLIRAVWTEDEVTLAGTSYELDGYSLFPPPIQKPPPIYVGALADKPIRRAARLGDGYILSAGSTFAEVEDRIPVYQAAVADTGQVLADKQPLAVNRVVHVVDSRSKRDQAVAWFSDRFLSFYDRWGHDDIAKLGSKERAFEETARAHFIIGEPSECVEQIERYRALGIGHLACLMNFGKPDTPVVESSMRLFGERVLPAFA
ncbi:MAG: LLM class flavin-dependent oxidoreductase [Myxococcota bacterium]